MVSKNESLMIYLFIFAFGTGFGTGISSIRYGIAAIVVVKLLNFILKLMGEWYSFIIGVVVMLLATYFIAPPFFTIACDISAIYLLLFFWSAYKLVKDRKRERAFQRVDEDNIANIYRELHEELNKN